MMTAVVLVGCGEKPASSTPKSEPKIPAPSQAAEAEAQVTPTPSPDPVSQADEKLIADPIVEKAVRESLEKPKGKLPEADLEKVTRLQLGLTKITDAGLKDVAKLQKLTFLGCSLPKSPTRASRKSPSCKDWPSCRNSKGLAWTTPKLPMWDLRKWPSCSSLKDLV